MGPSWIRQPIGVQGSCPLLTATEAQHSLSGQGSLPPPSGSPGGLKHQPRRRQTWEGASCAYPPEGRDSIGGGEGQILHKEGVYLSLFGTVPPGTMSVLSLSLPPPASGESYLCFSPALLAPIPLGARLASPSADPERPLPTAAPPARPRLRSPRASVQGRCSGQFLGLGLGLSPSPPHPPAPLHRWRHKCDRQQTQAETPSTPPFSSLPTVHPSIGYLTPRPSPFSSPRGHSLSHPGVCCHLPPPRWFLRFHLTPTPIILHAECFLKRNQITPLLSHA